MTAYASGGYSVQSTLSGPGGVLETTITPLTGLAVDAETGKPGVQIALNTGNQIAGAVADYGSVTAEFKLLDSDHGNVEVPPTYPA